jgi:hypothetical protein
MFLTMLPTDAGTESRGYVPLHAGETKTIQLKP